MQVCDDTVYGFDHDQLDRAAASPDPCATSCKIREDTAENDARDIVHDIEIEDPETASDLIWVLEPTVSLEMNVMKFFRIGAGASYRYVLGVDSGGLTNEDFGGLSAMLILKFGRF